MKNLLNQSILAAAAFAFIAGLPALSYAEETQSMTRVYSYDTNKDGIIQPEELTTYLYTRSDSDGDGYMADEEWKVNISRWYRPYKDVNYNLYTYWDQDKDNRLDANEVKTLIEKTGLYSKWDVNTDGKVSNDEFEKGTFAAYDDNDDGALSLDEWKAVLK